MPRRAQRSNEATAEQHDATEPLRVSICKLGGETRALRKSQEHNSLSGNACSRDVVQHAFEPRDGGGQIRFVLLHRLEKTERIPRVVRSSRGDVREAGTVEAGHQIENVSWRGIASVNHHHCAAAVLERKPRQSDRLISVRIDRRAHPYFAPSTTGASPDSISCRNRSSHGGSFKLFPRFGSSSSMRNPGPTVASSKSTPPGSRK